MGGLVGGHEHCAAVLPREGRRGPRRAAHTGRRMMRCTIRFLREMRRNRRRLLVQCSIRFA